MKIITTVGTSIFTNYNTKDEVIKDYPELSRDYDSITTPFKNLKDVSASSFTDSRYESDKKYVREIIQYLWLEVAKEKSCAELQTLYKIAEETGEVLEVYLLATDTVLSVLACELIKVYLLEKKTINGKTVSCVFNNDINSADTSIVKGLQVKNAKEFINEGFNNLFKIINELSKKGKSVLNISGGYKAILPYLTLFAQVKGIPLKYKYEDSDELISIGNLPFHFDYSLFEDEFLAFEAIKSGKAEHNLPNKEYFLELLEDKNNFKKLQEKQLIQLSNDKIKLSLLGKMLYEEYEKDEKDEGFNASNLLGFTMEALIFKFFNSQYPSLKNQLGQDIGQSEQGDAYDIDVFVETDSLIWAIEVKPQNVKVLINPSESQKKQMKTLEYKCSHGAFKNANEQYKNKKLNIAVFMYHHIQPNSYQQNNFIELKNKFDYIRWIWLQPDKKYKGNVNWSVTTKRLKEFDFVTKKWTNFIL
jgi:CRISPR/Cas system-associated protein Csm6